MRRKAGKAGGSPAGGGTKAAEPTAAKIGGRVELSNRPSEIEIAKGWSKVKSTDRATASEFLDQVERKKGAMGLRALAMDHGVSTQVNPGGKGMDFAPPIVIRERLLDKTFSDKGVTPSSKAGGHTTEAKSSQIVQGFRNQATDAGVRIDHDYAAGRHWMERHGGELISSKTGVNGKLIETWRVRAKDKDVLATWGRGGAIVRSGRQLPDQWQLLVS